MNACKRLVTDIPEDVNMMYIKRRKLFFVNQMFSTMICSFETSTLIFFSLWPGTLRWARHFILTVPLFTQEYKWVPVHLMLGLTLRRTRGRRHTPSRFMLPKTEISAALMGHLAHMQTYPFFTLPSSPLESVKVLDLYLRD